MKLVQNIGEASVIESNYFEDSRGVFLKVFNTDLEVLKEYNVRQINYVMTSEKGTLRGLHYQKDQFAESKIFRVIKGAAQVAFVDVRQSSQTFLKAFIGILDNPKQAIVIPRGFATGYCTLTEDLVMLYSADNDYHPQAEAGLLWNDPALAIEWLIEDPILSEKDKTWTAVQKDILSSSL